MPTIVFHLEDGSALTHTIEVETTTIGRHPDSIIVLTCPSVSGHHATVTQRENGFYVEDHHSSNGTRVNGAEVEEALLKDGDRLAFGDIQAVFYEGAPPRGASSPANPALAAMPAPNLVSEHPPAVPTRAKPHPAPAKHRPHKPSNYPDTSENGCMTAVVVTFLFIAAFIIGLSVRHHKETEGGNFIGDLFSRLSSGIPKIKIEKKAD